MNISRLLLVILSFSYFHDCIADLRVIVEQNGSTSVMKIGSTWASIVDQSSPEYALINMKLKKFYVVERKHKVVIDMTDTSATKSSAESESSTDKKPRVEVRKVGAGPTLLGYKTTEYKLMANDTFCSTQYFTRDLLKHKEIRAFDKVTAIINSNQDRHVSPCEFAQNQIDKNVMKYGIALMSKKADGSLDYKVKEINFKVKFTAGDFALPRNFPIMSMKQLMQQAEERGRKETKKLMQENKAN